jgi:hypothetical protein
MPNFDFCEIEHRQSFQTNGLDFYNHLSHDATSEKTCFCNCVP